MLKNKVLLLVMILVFSYSHAQEISDKPGFRNKFGMDFLLAFKHSFSLIVDPVDDSFFPIQNSFWDYSSTPGINFRINYLRKYSFRTGLNYLYNELSYENKPFRLTFYTDEIPFSNPNGTFNEGFILKTVVNKGYQIPFLFEYKLSSNINKFNFKIGTGFVRNIIKSKYVITSRKGQLHTLTTWCNRPFGINISLYSHSSVLLYGSVDYQLAGRIAVSLEASVGKNMTKDSFYNYNYLSKYTHSISTNFVFKLKK